VEKHFEGKGEKARPLYEKLLDNIEKGIGPVKVESLPCCIHLVGHYTFGAVYALRKGIRIHFILDRMLESGRIGKWSKNSASRYSYSVGICRESEIDKELLSWLRQAYNLKRK